MSAQAKIETPLAPAGRSKKLTVAVVVLLLLPVVLLFPFYDLAQVWIFPMAAEELQQCTDFICQAATDWERQAWLLVLGPSILAALLSILLGSGALIWMRGHTISPKNVSLLWTLVFGGIIWALIFGCTFWGLLYLASIHD
jgi:hypothetical protein